MRVSLENSTPYRCESSIGRAGIGKAPWKTCTVYVMDEITLQRRCFCVLPLLLGCQQQKELLFSPSTPGIEALTPFLPFFHSFFPVITIFIGLSSRRAHEEQDANTTPYRDTRRAPLPAARPRGTEPRSAASSAVCRRRQGSLLATERTRAAHRSWAGPCGRRAARSRAWRRLYGCESDLEEKEKPHPDTKPFLRGR